MTQLTALSVTALTRRAFSVVAKYVPALAIKGKLEVTLLPGYITTLVETEYEVTLVDEDEVHSTLL